MFPAKAMNVENIKEGDFAPPEIPPAQMGPILGPRPLPQPFIGGLDFETERNAPLSKRQPQAPSPPRRAGRRVFVLSAGFRRPACACGPPPVQRSRGRL